MVVMTMKMATTDNTKITKMLMNVNSLALQYGNINVCRSLPKVKKKIQIQICHQLCQLTSHLPSLQVGMAKQL